MTKLIDYALSFLGTPYIWAGNHPAYGYDCSGLVQEILASVGLDPKGDQTAQALYDHFIKEGDEHWSPLAGSLMFYGKDKQSITHVAFCISAHQVIEAGGGGSRSVDLASSVKEGGFVRLRPVDHRKDLVSVIRPKYADWINQMELPLG